MARIKLLKSFKILNRNVTAVTDEDGKKRFEIDFDLEPAYVEHEDMFTLFQIIKAMEKEVNGLKGVLNFFKDLKQQYPQPKWAGVDMVDISAWRDDGDGNLILTVSISQDHPIVSYSMTPSQRKLYNICN